MAVSLSDEYFRIDNFRYSNDDSTDYEMPPSIFVMATGQSLARTAS